MYNYYFHSKVQAVNAVGWCEVRLTEKKHRPIAFVWSPSQISRQYLQLQSHSYKTGAQSLICMQEF